MSRKAIDRAREEITAGWLAGDADAILVHMTDDAMFLGPHEPPVVGKSAIQTWLAGELNGDLVDVHAVNAAAGD